MKKEYNDVYQSSEINLTDEQNQDLVSNLSSEIDSAESYLNEVVRPESVRSWKYYKRELPEKPSGSNRSSYVDNTVACTVDHYQAVARDAFTDDDTFQIVADTDSRANEVINKVVSDVLNVTNNRNHVYSAFIKDALISKAGIMKPRVSVSKSIKKIQFKDMPSDQVNVMMMSIESSDDFESVELIIYEKDFESQASIFNDVSSDTVASEAYQQEFLTGCIKTVKEEKTIKIDNIPPDNFIVNQDAKTLDDARIVGHKTTTTISDLLKMGFDDDVVREVAEKNNAGKGSDINTAANERKSTSSISSYRPQGSQKEIELYEIYYKTSLDETDDVVTSNLYKIFYVDNIILSCEEVESQPYVGCSSYPIPHEFWGESMASKCEDIQRAKTGLYRNEFEYNDTLLNPTLIIDLNGIEAKDIINYKESSIIQTTNTSAVSALSIPPLSGNSAILMQALDKQREAGTGAVFTGNSQVAEAVKAGGSGIAASLILSENQTLQKGVINTFLESGIKPLIAKIYETLRHNFVEVAVKIDGVATTTNPSEWPDLEDIVVKTPIGQSAKMQQAQVMQQLYESLNNPSVSDNAVMSDAYRKKKLLIDTMKLAGVHNVSQYLSTDDEMLEKDQLINLVEQLTARTQELEQENFSLSSFANSLTERDLALKERIADSKIQSDADKQVFEEEKQQFKEEVAADNQVNKDRELDIKESELIYKTGQDNNA